MDNPLEQLERLARLRAQGALSDAEFDAEKARLLGGGDHKPPSPGPSPSMTSTAHVRAPRTALRRFVIVMGLLSATAVVAGGIALYALRETTPTLPKQPAPAVARRDAPAPPPRQRAAEQPPLVLNDDLQFSDPGNCKASSGTDALFNRILTPPDGDVANISSKPIRVGADRREVQSVLTRTQGENAGEQIFEGTAELPQPASWRGLRVTGIAASLYVIPEADSTYTRQIRFLDDPATVQAALGQMGFVIPREQGYAELHDDSCGGSMQIVAFNGGSALQCSWGC